MLNEFSTDEILKYAIENNIIDIVDTQKQIENMKKERYLEMHNHNVWLGNDGKWRTYLDDDSTRGYSLKVRTTKEAIDNLICRYYKDKEEDPYIEEVFEEWNKQRLEYGEISAQSYNRYADDFKRYFTKDCILYRRKIRLITENDLETFIKSTIRKFNMTHKMFAGLRTVIRGIFRFAKRKKYTNISITQFFGDLDLSSRIFQKKITDKEKEVFSESEIKVVKAYLQNRATIRDLGVLLAFETGLRVGELCAIKKKDILISKKAIHIQRTEITYKNPNDGSRVCEVREFPKTAAGDRYLFVPETAMRIIEAIIELNPNGEYLFWESGRRIRGNAFNRRLTRVCDDLKIPQRSMHKIRKTYGTTLIDNRVDESLIAEQMGHSDIATTKKYYYYSNKDDTKKYEQINKALSC